MNALASKMNFSVIISLPLDGSYWGWVRYNGSITGMIGASLFHCLHVSTDTTHGTNLVLCQGRAVAQRLDAGFLPWRPGFAYGQHVGFVVDRAALGQVFSEYFGFPCQSFHRFLHYHNHLGLTQLAIKWPQCRVDLDSTPH
jgi:hypothetical protein